MDWSFWEDVWVVMVGVRYWDCGSAIVVVVDGYRALTLTLTDIRRPCGPGGVHR